MPTQRVLFGKIVATPSASAWSQAYHAGNLFAVLALSKRDTDEQEKSLHMLGRELFNTLEAEFFTLEEKSLTLIKQALLDVAKVIPQDVSVSFCVAYIKDSTLYLFLLGAGTIALKRGDKCGVLLQSASSSQTDSTIRSASGYLQNGDVLTLQTEQFASLIPDAALAEALTQRDVTDMTETLSPLVHNTEEGGASAMFVVYKGVEESVEALVEDEEEEEEVRPIVAPLAHQSDETLVRAPQLEERTYPPQNKKRSLFTVHSFSLPLISLSHKRKVFLSVAVILLCVLLGSIFLTTQHKEDTETKELFARVYPEAQKQYDEGQGLVALNKSLSQDDFRKAKKILEENQAKFREGSEERQKIDALLQSVNSQLDRSSEVSSVPVKEVTDGVPPLLTAAKQQADGLSFAQYENTSYVLTSKDVFTTTSDGNKDKTLLENDADWSDTNGMGVYLGNIYILDRKEGLLKFLAGSGGYGKNNYFSSNAPDMSKAAHLAIDGSVYILNQDGTIAKYTSGSADTFKLSGLTTPLSSPTRLFTNSDTDNLYVLDTGNGRVVKLSKTGAYGGEYHADVVKSAKEFVVSEKDKKAYILSHAKIYELPL